MVVIKPTFHTEARYTTQVQHASHLADALNAYLLAAPYRRREKDLDPDIRSEWRALAASYQCSIKRDVACEAALCMVACVLPVEDNGKLQLVSRSSPALRICLNDSNRMELHSAARV